VLTVSSTIPPVSVWPSFLGFSVLASVIVIVVGLVFGEAAVLEGLSLGASEVLVDLLASTPVVEGSTTDRTRGLSTFRVVCESAITIFGSIE
jgi:hypothetical protein